LTLQDGTAVSEHELKAGILWNAFKNQMRLSEFSQMAFNLQQLITPVELLGLDEHFSWTARAGRWWRRQATARAGQWWLR
jgi:hypothetical protein